jgi:hypothetical protein
MAEGPGTEVQQGNIRVNGVRFESNGGVPHLPIIEPERAAAPPLTITLSDLYRYRLAGRETVRGRDCYVIAFAPRQGGESLFDGRAWIDAATFAMARVSATQTGLKGPIVASEQADDFEPDARGRWLLARSDVRQAYEGASVRTPIHRLLIVDRHEVNAPDFAARLAAAHASADVMLRETPDGFRYLARTKTGKREDGKTGKREDEKTRPSTIEALHPACPSSRLPVFSPASSLGPEPGPTHTCSPAPTSWRSPAISHRTSWPCPAISSSASARTSPRCAAASTSTSRCQRR